jgi:hypothetical protein
MSDINGETSDGFHTFNELYEHRLALTAALFRAWDQANPIYRPPLTWRSKAHHPDDRPIYAGYFIVGAEWGNSVITYHYPISAWDLFSGTPEREHAPKWDGADANDTIVALHAWVAVT